MTKRFALAALVLAGPACSGIRVQSELHVQELDAYTSYAWRASGSTERGEDQELALRIQRAVDEELSARGMRETAVGDAELLVAQEVVFELKTVFLDPYYSVVYKARRYEDGLLTITFEDSETEELVWSGTARSRLRTVAQAYGLYTLTWVDTTEPPQWRAREMVTAVLDRFPLPEKGASR